MGGVLTGTLSGGGAMTGSMAAGVVANKKPGTYTVTPETLAKILKMAEPGATIKLSPGEYGRIDLHGQNAYPEDCTFIGCEGATVAGVSITSGVISDTLQASADISNAILPQGLTFEGVAFTDSFCLRNARVDNLTLDNCRFGEKTNICISPECFVDAYGDDRYSEVAGNGSIYRFPYAHLGQKNLVIRNCELADATGTPQYEDGQASTINVVGVDGVTIYHNTTSGGYNGIQVGGQITDYGILSCGKVSITKNAVKNTQSRGINVHSIFGGDVTVAENALEAINHADKIIVRYSENTTLAWDVWGENATYSKPNTCDGKAISVGSGIVVADTVTSPADHYTALTAGISKEYTYNGSRDETEEKLEAWLNETVLPNMDNDSIRNISIRCGGSAGDGKGIIPWPALGTIHKHTDTYATIEVTTQVHGKRYTKLKNGVWQSTVCETDKLDKKADKTTVDAALAQKADKATMQTALNGKMSQAGAYYYSDYDSDQTKLNNWLDALLASMPAYSAVQVQINCHPAITGVRLAGMLYKFGVDQYGATPYATVELHTYGRLTYTKTKTAGKWNDAVLNQMASYNLKADGTLEITTI